MAYDAQEQLAAEFGSGFDTFNLRNVRMSCQPFPIRDALRHELSWTHYRLLMRLDDVCISAGSSREPVRSDTPSV